MPLSTIAVTLALWGALAAPVAAAPLLRLTSLDGRLTVKPADGAAETLTDLRDTYVVPPGSVVDVSAGAAAFDTGLGASLRAGAGCRFELSSASWQGAEGLRVRALAPGQGIDVVVGSSTLRLGAGARVELYPGVLVAVSGGEVTLEGSGTPAPGLTLHPGEMVSMAPGTPAAPPASPAPGEAREGDAY